MDIRNVAASAKVSIATVSRTINMVPSVDPALAARVWKAIEELNYFPNTQARALVSGKSRLFGLIVSDITNPFFPELIQGFEQVAVEHGYEILIGSTNYEPKKVEHCIRRMLERKVDGVAIMTFGIEEPLLDQLASRDIPMIFIDVGSNHPRSSVLSIDYRHGIQQAVQHLATLGHRDIGFISGPLRLHSAQARRDSFLASMKELGIKPQARWMLEGDHTLAGGRDVMQQLLRAKQRPTALMCSNDMTAFGVLHALFGEGLRAPEDLSVIGFDDVNIAEYMLPPLTTIRMSCIDLARAAVDALVAHLDDSGTLKAQKRMEISTELVTRRTTGPPPGTPSTP
jgi:DNA-binding LacI/PurR family transcriptional regulator